MSWMVWEEQTCDQIDRLYRAIGSRVMKTSIVKLELDSCEFELDNPFFKN